MTRRSWQGQFVWLAGVVAVAAVAVGLIFASRQGSSPAVQERTSDVPQSVVVYRSPTCTCCGEYEAYLRDQGFAVRSELVDDVATVKARFGVPQDATSCHTALVDGYVVEGHVPVAAIDRLLSQRPDIDGLALPGMPAGSPGMGGSPDGPLTILSIDGGTTEPYMTL